MEEIFVVIILVLLLIWLIFCQLERLKFNHPNSDLIVGLLNRSCSNSKAFGVGETNKKPKQIGNFTMEKKKSVLFICVHNSGRSQMAEAFLRAYAGNIFDVESAGLEPREINKLVIRVMKEMNIDISGNTSDSVFELYKKGRLYDYVISVCDESIETQCPIFPGITRRLHWPFPDPSSVGGTDEEKLSKVRKIRDDIYHRIMNCLNTFA